MKLLRERLYRFSVKTLDPNAFLYSWDPSVDERPKDALPTIVKVFNLQDSQSSESIRLLELPQPLTSEFCKNSSITMKLPKNTLSLLHDKNTNFILLSRRKSSDPISRKYQRSRSSSQQGSLQDNLSSTLSSSEFCYTSTDGRKNRHPRRKKKDCVAVSF